MSYKLTEILIWYSTNVPSNVVVNMWMWCNVQGRGSVPFLLWSDIIWNLPHFCLSVTKLCTYMPGRNGTGCGDLIGKDFYACGLFLVSDRIQLRQGVKQPEFRITLLFLCISWFVSHLCTFIVLSFLCMHLIFLE